MIAAAAAALSAQTASPTLRIASPADGAYVSGATRLVAVFDPPSAARQVQHVTFFADAAQVCRVFRPPFECDWDAGERVIEHHVRAVATTTGGAKIIQTVRTKGLEYAESVDVDVIQVTAVVTDGDGRFVRGLKRTDFTVHENDRPQEITHFAAENIPLEMVTALDVSSSMTDALPLVKDSAKKFLSGLEPRDQVTLLSFNENIFTLARRATDQALRARAIDRMASWGGTALYDVLVRSIDLLGRQTGRRSILLFTDGDDQSSHIGLKGAIARTEESDATIYAIGLGRAVGTPELQRLMKQITTTSGGRAFFTDDPQRLDQVFAEILEDLRNQYLIAYPAPASSRDGKWHSIRVEAGNGRYKVRARQGYRIEL